MIYKFDNENHVHSLDGRALTGTSSVGNVLAKPALIQWAANMACDYIDKNFPTLDELMKNPNALKELLAEAKYAHKKKKEKAAGEGTDMHAQLENWVKWKMGKCELEDYDPKIEPFINWANENVKEFIASEAHCFEQNLFVGGITDCVAELTDGSIAIIDFKSSKEAYKTHAIQGAGYAIQIDANGLFSEDGEHNKKLERPIDVVIIVPFGASKVEPVIFRDIETYKQAFRSAVVLYRLMFNHEDY